MDRKILLEYYLNKYVVPDYLLIKRIDVENILEVKDNRIDVDIQIICNYDEFKSKFDLTESLEEMFVHKNRISQTFLLAPVFKKSTEIDFDKLKRDIKHYIKIVISKRINLFNMNLKLENSHSDNNKQSS
jgi:hypothetical protein